MEQNDLSFKNALSPFGEVEVYDRVAKDDVVIRIGDAEAIFTNKVVIDSTVFDACPNIKFVGVNATGYNVVDIVEAKKRGIIVCNVPSYSTDSVAQHTFALLLELCSRVGVNDASVHNGGWVNSKDFCYTVSAITELSGKTMGIIGFGNIGQKVASIASAFGMKILAYNRTAKSGTVPLETVLKNSDVISLHCALSNDNLKMVNKEFISKLKDNAIIINTARGGLLDEQAVCDALNSGKLYGVAVDVLSSEPPSADNPLLKAKNCIITPHTAWMSFEARQRLLNVTVENLKRFIEKKPQNVVS